MSEKLFDSEIKVMEIIWEKGPLSAKEISLIAADSIGWNKNTTYTVIKKCVAKGAIERIEPGFVCRPLIGKETAQDEEVDDMIDRVFDGSVDLLFAALLRRETLTAEQIESLRRRVDELSGEQK